MKAIVVRDDKPGSSSLENFEFEDELAENWVEIHSQYSSINYKDALAVTGKGAILRKWPLIPGIDVVGKVVASRSDQVQEGQTVVVTGCGLGERENGGFSEMVRCPSDWVVPLPGGLTEKESMVLGTAGFTAALCLFRMQQNGQKPENGPIAVTGASGGVGSIAVNLLSDQGFEVVAVSEKRSFWSKLRELGAAKVISRHDLVKEGQTRPLESAQWGGAIDNLGGQTLSALSAQVRKWGSVACVGLAESSEFQSTVMPFILRGVSLLGISSTNCPMPWRREIWNNLASSWKPSGLASISNQTLTLDHVIPFCDKMLARETTGRNVLSFVSI